MTVQEADDYLHDPNPELDRYMDSKMKTYSLAGIIDTGAIAIIVIVSSFCLICREPSKKALLSGG